MIVSILGLLRAQGLAVSLSRCACSITTNMERTEPHCGSVGASARCSTHSYATSSKAAYFARPGPRVRDFLSPASLSDPASWRRRPTLARKRSLGNHCRRLLVPASSNNGRLLLVAIQDLPSHPQPARSNLHHAHERVAAVFSLVHFRCPTPITLQPPTLVSNSAATIANFSLQCLVMLMKPIG